MEKRSSIYSDRPRFVLLAEIMGWNPNTAFLTYGRYWRKHRQWIQAMFYEKDSLTNHIPAQRHETYLLLAAFIEAPELFLQHLRRFPAALIANIVFGQQIPSEDDGHLQTAIRAIEATIEAGSLAASLVDFFPFLKHVPAWIPGAGFKRKALDASVLIRRMMDQPFEAVKAQIACGNAKPSFVASLLEDSSQNDGSREYEENVKGAAGALYAAGIDTITITLWTFVLAMVHHPETFKKAQEEIQNVIGDTRLPELEDRSALPYLECVIKEVYRWNCPLSLGLAHRLTTDDEYRGYFMPKGAMIIPNIWSMSQNMKFYPEPDIFRPERFLGLDDDVAEIRDPRKFVFGFGRRICPGRYFADNSIWLAVANIVAAFDIRKARDVQGNEIIPPVNFKSGFVSYPEEFVCKIIPRSTRISKLVFTMLDASDHSTQPSTSMRFDGQWEEHSYHNDPKADKCIP